MSGLRACVRAAGAPAGDLPVPKPMSLSCFTLFPCLVCNMQWFAARELRDATLQGGRLAQLPTRLRNERGQYCVLPCVRPSQGEELTRSWGSPISWLLSQRVPLQSVPHWTSSPSGFFLRFFSFEVHGSFSDRLSDLRFLRPDWRDRTWGVGPLQVTRSGRCRPSSCPSSFIDQQKPPARRAQTCSDKRSLISPARLHAHTHIPYAGHRNTGANDSGQS